LTKVRFPPSAPGHSLIGKTLVSKISIVGSIPAARDVFFF
jgi:hypothetical protein